jgi:hypothetical protein
VVLVAAAPVIIIVAGTMTFGNSWLQEQKINWKVPIATLLLAAGAQGLAAWSPQVANGLATMVLIGAAITKVNGKSAIDEINSTITGAATSSGTKSKGTIV